MAGKKAKGKKQTLNLHNPKQVEVINLFALSEGRLSKSTIMEHSNKDVFYRMVNGGYIKETVKGSGMFKATSKLKQLTESSTGVSYSNGCSNNHSQIMTKAASMLPRQVVMEGRFEGQNQIKTDFEKYKSTDDYKNGIKQLRNSAAINLEEVRNRISENMDSQERINCIKDLDIATTKYEIAMGDNPCFTPDMMIQVTPDEVEELISVFEDRLADAGRKEEMFLQENIEKLQTILMEEQEIYEIGMEIVTSSYGTVEIEMHRNYEILTSKQVLYIC